MSIPHSPLARQGQRLAAGALSGGLLCQAGREGWGVRCKGRTVRIKLMFPFLRSSTLLWARGAFAPPTAPREEGGGA